jgi:hypothetical protein
MNPKAAVIPRAVALTAATLTVTKAEQITSNKLCTIAAIVLLQQLCWLSVPIFWLCGVQT